MRRSRPIPRGASGLLWLAVLAAPGCRSTVPDEVEIARAEDRREAASTVLFEAIERGSPALRARAALAMGRIQEPGYAEPLARAVTDESVEVRRAALFALGQLGLAEGAVPSEVAVAAAVGAAEDADPLTAAAAVEAMGKLAWAGAASAIEPYLAHAAPDVRARAAEALFRLRFVPVWRREAEEPPALPPSGVRALIAALGDPVAEVRAAAAHGLSRYGQAEAVEALGRRLRDEDEWVRMFSARALGRSGQVASTEVLLEAVADDSPRVRTEAVAALAALGRAARLPARLADDPSLHVRAAYARALGGPSDDAGPRTLRRLEADPSPTVVAAATEALARRLGEAYREDLVRHLRDARWPVRAAAARACASLERSGVELASQVWASDAVTAVRVAALEVLAGASGGRAAVEQALAADDLALRGTAVGLLERVVEDPAARVRLLGRTYEASPGADWIEVREAIVEALGGLAGAEGAKALLERAAASDPAPSVRRRAARGPGRVESVSVAPSPPEPAASTGPGPALGTDPVVVLETDKGTMRLRCLAREAPVHVATFVELIERGHYDGLLWHRVVSDFVIQGGDPRGDGWGGAGILLRDEINRVRFARGSVGMPKAGKDTGGGQLFVTHVPTPHLDGNYTVFAEVVSGLEVIDRIEVGDRIVRAALERSMAAE